MSFISLLIRMTMGQLKHKHLQELRAHKREMEDIQRQRLKCDKKSVYGKKEHKLLTQQLKEAKDSFAKRQAAEVTNLKAQHAERKEQLRVINAAKSREDFGSKAPTQHPTRGPRKRAARRRGTSEDSAVNALVEQLNAIPGLENEVIDLSKLKF
eukprot:TRINITY_DN8048_c0_g1_i2.p1 TRINITY_DN8048_c0_g1~~TRINITY_DN8048_c0_g1_i2.p1  ORF type:complete len:154 (-),score=29.46 TRINITY_DN8048_c0_g1_i2:196-657(-)